MNRVCAMMLRMILAFGVGVDAGAEYARSRQGSSSGASANVPSAVGDEFVKVCLKQTFSVSQLRYAHNATDIKRRLSDNSEPTRQDVDARFLNGLRRIGSSRLQKQVSSNCEHFDADLQMLKQAQDKVNKCKERQSLEITAPSIEEIRRAKREASEKQQPYKEPGPKCSKSDKKEEASAKAKQANEKGGEAKSAQGKKTGDTASTQSGSEHDPACKQALEELKKTGGKPSEASHSAHSAQLHPKLDGRLGLGSRADQNAQQRQIDQHQQAAKAKCQDEIDKANLDNGLLRHLGDDEPTSGSIEKARKACAQDAQKNQQALDKLEINPQSRTSLALLANTSLANEYLKGHPESCESYQRLRAELERIAVRENIPAAALAGGTALGCALNPAICGVLSAGAATLSSSHSLTVANELERQAAAIRAAGGPESEVKRLLEEAEKRRIEAAGELAIGLAPGVARVGRRALQDAGETGARHAKDLPTNIAAGDSAAELSGEHLRTRSKAILDAKGVKYRELEDGRFQILPDDSTELGRIAKKKDKVGDGGRVILDPKVTQGAVPPRSTDVLLGNRALNSDETLRATYVHEAGHAKTNVKISPDAEFNAKETWIVPKEKLNGYPQFRADEVARFEATARQLEVDARNGISFGIEDPASFRRKSKGFAEANKNYAEIAQRRIDSLDKSNVVEGVRTVKNGDGVSIRYRTVGAGATKEILSVWREPNGLSYAVVGRIKMRIPNADLSLPSDQLVAKVRSYIQKQVELSEKMRWRN